MIVQCVPRCKVTSNVCQLTVMRRFDFEIQTTTVNKRFADVFADTLAAMLFRVPPLALVGCN
jgi:hypothetical protein